MNKEHVDVVEALLRLGADPNLQDIQGDTAYQDAVTKKNDTILSLILNNGYKF